MKGLAAGIRNGDRRSISKSLSIVESSLEGDRALARELLAELGHNTSNRMLRVGITGSPGAGKSSMIEGYGSHYLNKNQNDHLICLCVDPSSAVSGGSILADKTRMPNLSVNPRAYIRPSPSKTVLGGLTAYTHDSVNIAQSSVFNQCIIETVGIGQSETDISNIVDIVILVVPPGGGDTYQGIKRGIMELADIVVVNKDDGDLRHAAKRAQMSYRTALSLLPRRHEFWSPRVLRVSSHEGEGIDLLDQTIQEFVRLADSQGIEKLRSDQRKVLLQRLVEQELVKKLRVSSYIGSYEGDEREPLSLTVDNIVGRVISKQ